MILQRFRCDFIRRAKKQKEVHTITRARVGKDAIVYDMAQVLVDWQHETRQTLVANIVIA
jgi:hypothetical protein